jgi:sporulation protein YlmC with PRC-barrel domain
MRYALWIVVFLSSPAGAQLAPLPPPGVQLVHIVSQPMRAMELIGMEVRSANGERNGKIENLVFDMEGNRVRHALVGLAERRYAVTLFDLRLSLPRTHLTLPADRSLLRPAPHAAGPTASDLLQRPVHDKRGDPLGELAEVLVDVHEGEVPFVLLHMGAKLHPLPLDALSVEGGRLALQIDAARLQPAHAFSAQTLAANLENGHFLRRHAAYADRLTIGG